MHAEPSLADTQKLELPPELVSALDTQKRRTDYGIEGLKPSLLGRLMEKLIAPRS